MLQGNMISPRVKLEALQDKRRLTVVGGVTTEIQWIGLWPRARPIQSLSHGPGNPKAQRLPMRRHCRDILPQLRCDTAVSSHLWVKILAEVPAPLAGVPRQQVDQPPDHCCQHCSSSPQLALTQLFQPGDGATGACQHL